VDGKTILPWFLSELDALAWEKSQLEKKKKDETKVPDVPYKYTPLDSQELRQELGETMGLIYAGDEIAVATSGNSMVVMAVGPVVADLLEAVKKVFDKINGIE